MGMTQVNQVGPGKGVKNGIPKFKSSCVLLRFIEVSAGETFSIGKKKLAGNNNQEGDSFCSLHIGFRHWIGYTLQN